MFIMPYFPEYAKKIAEILKVELFEVESVFNSYKDWLDPSAYIDENFSIEEFAIFFKQFI